MNLGGTIRFNKIGIALVCGILVIFILYTSPRSYPVDDGVSINLRRLLLVSIQAAERGGKEVVKVINQANLKEKSKGKTKEGVNEPVTNADYKSHCVMYYGITKSFPTIRVISEEHMLEENCQQSLPLEIEYLEKNLGTLGIEGLYDVLVNPEQVAVWIDPLDATKEYTQELYNYVTTMVCVAVDGNPVIGIIHKPFGPEPRTTWAWAGKGMSPNLKNRKTYSGDKKSVIISKSHPGSDVDERVRNAFGKDVEIIQAGGSGYKSLEVAVGNVTAYVHTNYISKWDICAGDAIISSLDGSFTSLNGDLIDFSASSEHSHKGGLLAIMSRVNNNIDYIEGLKKHS